MRHLIPTVLCAAVLLTSTHCDKEPTQGHLKLTVAYPEIIIESDTMYWLQVPGVGAEVKLYDKDAICKGYKDAMLGIAWLVDKYVSPKYSLEINSEGEILFNDIHSGGYFLIVYARRLSKYTEKYIEVIGGDTLKLKKVFTPDGSFLEDLEPWDYVMPPLY